jgi:hypothetical protein
MPRGGGVCPQAPPSPPPVPGSAPTGGRVSVPVRYGGLGEDDQLAEAVLAQRGGPS